jgi:hypothetical protein
MRVCPPPWFGGWGGGHTRLYSIYRMHVLCAWDLRSDVPKGIWRLRTSEAPPLPPTNHAPNNQLNSPGGFHHIPPALSGRVGAARSTSGAHWRPRIIPRGAAIPRNATAALVEPDRRDVIRLLVHHDLVIVRVVVVSSSCPCRRRPLLRSTRRRLGPDHRVHRVATVAFWRTFYP